MISEIKTCLHCSRNIKGRTDKKFCTDYCRNAYHNQLNSSSNNLVRSINYCLRKNRRILEEILSSSLRIKKIHRRVLQQKGFSFDYYTHSWLNKKQDRCYFCYEFGYRIDDENTIMILKRENTGKSEKINS